MVHLRRLGCDRSALFGQLLLCLSLLFLSGVTSSETTPDAAKQLSAINSDSAEQAVKKQESGGEKQAEKPHWQPPAVAKPAPFSKEELSKEQAKMLKEKWGIKVLGLRVVSAGMMMDFRFHVVDVDKALPLFDHRIKPYVETHGTKIKLPIPMAPKVGGLRPTNRGKNIRAGRNYDIIFGNPDRYVKVGERVNVVIGDFRVENLLVN